MACYFLSEICILGVLHNFVNTIVVYSYFVRQYIKFSSVIKKNFEKAEREMKHIV